MDIDNQKDFSDRLTWLFGHARGGFARIIVCLMVLIITISRSILISLHPYVVIETPQRKYAYHFCLVIVPEETPFYRIHLR